MRAGIFTQCIRMRAVDSSMECSYIQQYTAINFSRTNTLDKHFSQLQLPVATLLPSTRTRPYRFKVRNLVRYNRKHINLNVVKGKIVMSKKSIISILLPLLISHRTTLFLIKILVKYFSTMVSQF